MRSEVVFVMHPSDEAEFVNLVIAEPGTVLVNGPTWSSPRPPIKTDIQSCGNYAMIWNPSETPALAGRHLRKENAEWWYCENEFLTIQFLRSGFQFGEPFLFEGRTALATTDKGGGEFHGPSAHAIEERFKRLRKFIKKNYANGVIIWQNTSLPRSKTNPLKH